MLHEEQQAFELKRQSRSASVSTYLTSWSPSVLDTKKDKHFTHSASHLRNTPFFPLWRRGLGAEAASVIIVSPCWHGIDHRDADPGSWTDVIHLALSVDTSSLHCMQRQHFTVTLRAEPATPENLHSAVLSYNALYSACIKKKKPQQCFCFRNGHFDTLAIWRSKVRREK